MTSLTTPAASRSVDASSDESAQTSAEDARREQQTLTEAILDSRARCPDSFERRRLQQEALPLNLRLADGTAAGYAGRGIERDDLNHVPCGYRMTRVVTGNAFIEPSDTSREVGENSSPWV